MRSKSKSKAKASSEQTVSCPAGTSSSIISPVSSTTKINPTTNQVEITYKQLVSLGMPTDVISLTEFEIGRAHV